MDNPREDTPNAALVPNGAYTIAAVGADEETAGMEVDFKGTHLQFKLVLRQHEDLEEEVSAYLAVLEQRDRSLDRQLNSFELRMLAWVDKNRDHKKYRLYIPKSIREITQAERRGEQPKKVQAILDTMAGELSDASTDGEYKDILVSQQGPITSKLAAVKQAIVQLAAAENALEALEETTIPNLRRTWIEKRIQLHGALTQKFPDDKERVESYLKRFHKRRTKAEEAAPESAAPAGGGGS